MKQFGYYMQDEGETKDPPPEPPPTLPPGGGRPIPSPAPGTEPEDEQGEDDE